MTLNQLLYRAVILIGCAAIVGNMAGRLAAFLI